MNNYKPAFCPFAYRWSSWYGLRHNLHGLYFDLKYGVQNLFIFFRLAFADRNWDYDYFLGMIEWKLLRMSRHTERYDRHLGAQRNALRMRVCAELLRRVREDNYRERLEQRDRFFGFPEVECEIYWAPTEDHRFHEMRFTDEDQPESYHKRKRDIVALAVRQREADLESFARIFSKYVLCWWD